MLALFALVALGAAAPAASPPPLAALPTVILYTLQANASLPRETNARIVTTIGNEIALGGQVRVIPGDPDVARADFLSTARKAGADFYLTGFLTPLGNGASIIVQLVSAQSGIIVFSNSGQLSTYSDAADQGDVIRQAIIHSGISRSYSTFLPDDGKAAAAPTAVPAHGTGTTASTSATAEPEANVGALFGHHKHAAAAAVASPSPSPSPSP
jgi:hypothetical protein